MDALEYTPLPPRVQDALAHEGPLGHRSPTVLAFERPAATTAAISEFFAQTR